MSHLFFPHTRFLLGNGLKIRFWKDLWWGETTLDTTYPRLLRIAMHKSAMVVEVLSLGINGINWNLLFTRDLYEWEISIVGELMENLCLVFIDRADRDSRIWAPSADDTFSFKSFFNILIPDQSFSPIIPVSNI